MPLPLLPLLPVITGIITAMQMNHKVVEINGCPPSSDFNFSKSKTTMNGDDKNQAAFVVALISAAASSDGCDSPEEREIIDRVVDEFADRFDLDKNFEQKLKTLASGPVSFKTLKDTYATLRSIDADMLDYFRRLLHNVLTADQLLTDHEKAFQFKCELMLENINDIGLFRVVGDDAKDYFDTEYLESVTINEVAKRFPDTDPSTLVRGNFYTTHPTNNHELVSFNLFFEDSFAMSKDTELVEAARLSGAKKITVISSSKDVDSSSLNVGVSGGAGVTGGPSAETGIKTAASSILDMEDKAALTFEFEGKRPGLFSNFKGNNERQILKKSKWLQHDANLVAFVKSCFGQNRVTTFEQEFEYTEIGNAMESATVASKCGLNGISVKASAEFKKKSEKLRRRKLKYVITFAK